LNVGGRGLQRHIALCCAHSGLGKMSMPLTQLLELSHELSRSRKRRCEWEIQAERRCRSRFLPGLVEQQPRHADARARQAAEERRLSEASSEEDCNEMSLLSETLAAQGLSVREPAAELAVMRLLLADARKPKAAVQGSDFGWLVGEEAAPSAPVAIKFMYATDVQQSEEQKEMRLQEALQRLLRLVKEPISGNDADSEDSDTEDDEARALRELSREVMQEAEWQELALITGAQNCEFVTPPLPSTSNTGSPIPSLIETKSGKVTPALRPSKVPEENVSVRTLAEKVSFATRQTISSNAPRTIPHL